MYKHGYGYVWEAQSLIKVDTFLHEFSSTIMDSEIQTCNTEVAQQPKLIMYIQFKRVFEPEAYLSIDMPDTMRNLTLFIHTALDVRDATRNNTVV